MFELEFDEFDWVDDSMYRWIWINVGWRRGDADHRARLQQVVGSVDSLVDARPDRWNARIPASRSICRGSRIDGEYARLINQSNHISGASESLIDCLHGMDDAIE